LRVEIQDLADKLIDHSPLANGQPVSLVTQMEAKS
jgi:hypothetical protein